MLCVIVLDPLSKEGLDLLQSAGKYRGGGEDGPEGQGSARRPLWDVDGAICRSGVKINAEALEGNRRLKAIGRAGVGADNIDRAATPGHRGHEHSGRKHDLHGRANPRHDVGPVAQHRPRLSKPGPWGEWDRNRYIGSQVGEKTLGIVGLGRIGQAVAGGLGPWT